MYSLKFSKKNAYFCFSCEEIWIFYIRFDFLIRMVETGRLYPVDNYYNYGRSPEAEPWFLTISRLCPWINGSLDTRSTSSYVVRRLSRIPRANNEMLLNTCIFIDLKWVKFKLFYLANPKYYPSISYILYNTNIASRINKKKIVFPFSSSQRNMNFLKIFLLTKFLSSILYS